MRQSINNDLRLNYLVQSFKSISRKPFETYVIQRIWHRLGDDCVQFVFQQYVNRGEKDKYALADLYLPQVKMVVEVNEKYHYTTEEQRERDAIRNAEIAKRGKLDVRVINCDQPLEAVHKDIEKVVEDAEYYKKKGCLNVDDNIYVQTIDDACDIFGIKAKHKGFLRAAGADIDEKTMLWTPDATNRLWENKLLEDGNLIEERPKKENGSPNHVPNALNTFDHRRVVFFRQRDDFGLNLYKFVGVFTLDAVRTKKENCTYWKKVSDPYKLK